MRYEIFEPSCATTPNPMQWFFDDGLDQPPPLEGKPDRQHSGTTGVRPLILMIEDSPTDVALVQEALMEHGVDCEFIALSDGEKATEYVAGLAQGQAECAAFIVLDLNLPRRHGCDSLGGHSIHRQVPVGSRCRAEFLGGSS